jgi:NADH dehydrogenase [ubiquinone] 1 alpha subcomplex assembly factor 7
MTALRKIIIEMIAAEGPMPLDRYMALCLSHPIHGYYMTRDPLGRAGDFTTAPEISQIFGELIGVWCLNTWEMLGSPSQFALVELGPGRGTLMADLLRAAKAVPEFVEAAQVQLVETSPVLRAAQREKLSCDVVWHETVESLPQLPSLIIANEFFDALPIRQFIVQQGKSFECFVGLADDKLKMGLVPLADLNRPDGIYESSMASVVIAEQLGSHLQSHGGAALIIDYGHVKTAAGDTLQALKAHQFCNVLDHVGEADITAHVDFEALGHAFEAGGARAITPLTQGQFLNTMGLQMRVEKLSAKLQGDAKAEFRSAVERIAGDDQMGHLFKVLAVKQKGLPPLYPFEVS